MRKKIFVLIISALSAFFIDNALAEMPCVTCHEPLTSEKVVHAAMQMGCETCHSAIDASDIPHKKTNNIAKGLSAEQPDLCYNCHDRTKFTRKNVHSAIAMGCTGCHNPHSSKKERLLNAEVPDICYNCHDRAEFNKKNVHMPVAGGMCMSCHDPHSTDNIAILNKEYNGVCIDCHGDVIKKPHGIKRGHRLGGDGRLDDPARKGKKFYCGSCHNPHSSDSIRLFRYDVKTPIKICVNCHKV